MAGWGSASGAEVGPVHLWAVGQSRPQKQSGSVDVFPEWDVVPGTQRIKLPRDCPDGT